MDSAGAKPGPEAVQGGDAEIAALLAGMPEVELVGDGGQPWEDPPRGCNSYRYRRPGEAGQPGGGGSAKISPEGESSPGSGELARETGRITAGVDLETAERDQARRIAEEWEAAAREDFSVFAEYVGRDEATGRRIRLCDLHRLVIRFIAYCEGIGKYAAIQMPYEHGKSSLFSVLYLLFKIGQNTNLTSKLVSASEDIVKVRVKQIRDHIDGKYGGAYNRVFPEVKPDFKAGYSSFQLHVEREVSAFPTVWAHSVMSTGEGGRCGFLLLDDIVSRSNALDKDMSAEIIRAVEGTWLKRCHPGSPVIFLNTPWTTSDAMSHIIKSRLKRWAVLIAGVNKDLDGYDIKVLGD